MPKFLLALLIVYKLNDNIPVIIYAIATHLCAVDACLNKNDTMYVYGITSHINNTIENINARVTL